MKVGFCAYRPWATAVRETIERHPKVTSVVPAFDNTGLASMLGMHTALMGNQPDPKPEVDIVLLCGWSTPPSEAMIKKGVPIFTEHPAADDRYSPGTPLQNQILDGVTRTKHRLVKVGYPELSLRQWSHEVDIDLSGNMNDILEQMTVTSKALFTRFLDDYPNMISWKTWPKVLPQNQMPRRNPGMSRLTQQDFKTLSTKQLYDKIRCLEEPYPNAFIEDKNGILYFERVRFKAK